MPRGAVVIGGDVRSGIVCSRRVKVKWKPGGAGGSPSPGTELGHRGQVCSQGPFRVLF